MDVRVKHIKTGEIKELPEKVFQQVQHKYKFLSYVQDPNVVPPSIQKEDVPPVADNGGLTQEHAIANTVEESLQELRERYTATTGKKPGIKLRATLEKELNQL
jgi:hypothetical protein